MFYRERRRLKAKKDQLITKLVKEGKGRLIHTLLCYENLSPIESVQLVEFLYSRALRSRYRKRFNKLLAKCG